MIYYIRKFVERGNKERVPKELTMLKTAVFHVWHHCSMLENQWGCRVRAELHQILLFNGKWSGNCTFQCAFQPQIQDVGLSALRERIRIKGNLVLSLLANSKSRQICLHSDTNEASRIKKRKKKKRKQETTLTDRKKSYRKGE